MLQVSAVERCFTAGSEAQRLTAYAPVHAVIHIDHVTDLVGMVRHAPVPKAHVANHDAALLRLRANRWRNLALRGDVVLVEGLRIQVRSGPQFGGTILFGHLHEKDVDCECERRVRLLEIGPEMWMITMERLLLAAGTVGVAAVEAVEHLAAGTGDTVA